MGRDILTNRLVHMSVGLRSVRSHKTQSNKNAESPHVVKEARLLTLGCENSRVPQSRASSRKRPPLILIHRGLVRSPIQPHCSGRFSRQGRRIFVHALAEAAFHPARQADRRFPKLIAQDDRPPPAPSSSARHAPAPANQAAPAPIRNSTPARPAAAPPHPPSSSRKTAVAPARKSDCPSGSAAPANAPA